MPLPLSGSQTQKGLCSNLLETTQPCLVPKIYSIHIPSPVDTSRQYTIHHQIILGNAWLNKVFFF